MAADVTDRLWEMADALAMLDAFNAKRKRGAKPVFEVEQRAIGGGYYVRATLPDGTLRGSKPSRRKVKPDAGLKTVRCVAP